MGTIENNKMIAEFMGVKPLMESPDVYTYSDLPFYSIREDNPEDVMEGIAKYVKYSSSWDWLIPVVEKCYDYEAQENEIGDITHALLDFDIDKTYLAVVAFLKTLN